VQDLRTLKRECLYGTPEADEILYNRHYVTGYSYYFRQPKWVLEIINPSVIDIDPETDVDRQDHFRKDFRVPTKFRAEKTDFRGSGFDRGHMVASANQRSVEIQNSETFLLTNMSPQYPALNRRVWADLENAVRQKNAEKSVLETFCVTGPLFFFDQPIITIGTKDANDVTIPVPHAFFKSILTENDKGKFYMWSFVMENKKDMDRKPLSEYQVTTDMIETIAGIELWKGLHGKYINWEKNRVRKMWKVK